MGGKLATDFFFLLVFSFFFFILLKSGSPLEVITDPSTRQSRGLKGELQKCFHSGRYIQERSDFQPTLLQSPLRCSGLVASLMNF